MSLIHSREFLLAFVVAVFAPLAVRAEIILDDFDDPAGLISPEMKNKSLITNDVGNLVADRKIGISALTANPIATLDISFEANSQLTGRMINLAPTGSSPIAVMWLEYSNYLGGNVDFTETDQNDAILFDFSSIRGPTPPAFVRALVFDESGTPYYNLISPVPALSEPTTLAMPFNSFIRRDGLQVSPDFSSINFMLIDIYANGFFGAPQELGWTFQLDRIRVGTIVPEPSLRQFNIIGMLLALAKRWKLSAARLK